MLGFARCHSSLCYPPGHCYPTFGFCFGLLIVSIRSKLILLVLAVLTPALLAASFAISYVYEDQGVEVERSMREATRALSLALDKDISRREAMVATLATAPALTRGDLLEFYQQARQIAPTWDTSVVLVDPDGQQLLNTRKPFGEPLPERSSGMPYPPSAEESVSNLYLSSISDLYSFSVRKAVIRDGQLRYYLYLSSSAQQLSELLTNQRLPPGWQGAVLDREGRIVARTHEAQTYVGSMASESFRKRVMAQEEGFQETVGRDGVSMVSYFSRAPSSRWAVVIAQPKHEVQRRTGFAVLFASLGAFWLLAIAIALAYWVGRKISMPLRILDAAAQAMGSGQMISPIPTGMVETDRTARVLAQASEQIQSAKLEMAARVAEAVAEVERSQRALLQSQKLEALGRLTGGIAHDFNNLLQALTVGLQLALRSVEEPRAQRALQACMRSVERGSKLTRQLMTFGRNQVSEARVLDLRELLLGMHDLLDGALPSRVQMRYELPEQPWPVFADPLQCELAVLNLVLNARDAMPAGGEVRISLCRVDQSLDSVELCVADTGSGMSEEVREKAFDPFYTTKEVGKGTGLGLAQVHGFAGASGGSVRIESEAGSGTRIILRLPLSDLPLSSEGSVDELTETSRPSARILVVDDDPHVLEVVSDMLQSMGYQVGIAHAGEQALAMYQATLEPGVAPSQRFDLLFSDIVMPGPLDGIGLALAVRALDPNLPILLATGYSERAPADFGFRVLAKPYRAATLADALRQMLQERSSSTD